MMAGKKQNDDLGLIEIVIPIELAQYLGSGNIDKEKFCRMCLNERPAMVSIFSESNGSQIAEMFTLFSGLQVFPNDTLPSQLCTQCKDQLTNCYEFKQLCQKSDIIWKAVLKGEFVTKIEDTCINDCTNKKDITDNKGDVNMFIDISAIDIKDESESNNGDAYEDSMDVDKSNISDSNSICKDQSDCIEAVSQQKKQKKKTKNKLKQSQEFEDQATVKCESDYLKGDRLQAEEVSSLCCGVCRQFFVDPSELLKHLQKHEIASSHSCSLCSKVFPKIKSLRHHIEMKHRSVTNKGFPCQYCEETFSSKGDLAIHSSVHEGNGRTCNKCFKEFSPLQRLKRHLSRHMEEKKYKCDICSKPFTELYALIRHRRIHTGEAIEKKHVCEVCNKRFANGYALRTHIARHLDAVPPYACSCGKRFASARLLRSHARVHDPSKPYACRYCDKRFRHESTRTTHHRTHTGEKPYICSICGKTFIQNSNLSLHMKTHSGEKKYQCTTCNRRFTALSTLKSHQDIHSGVKLFSCPVCGKRFRRKNMVTAHLRGHPDAAPRGEHSCSACRKRFATAARLRDHGRVHTGEKPFECNMCHQKFATKSYLAKHIKVHEARKRKKKVNITKVNKTLKSDHSALSSTQSKLIKNEYDMLKEAVYSDVDHEMDVELDGKNENLSQTADATKSEIVILEQDQNIIEVTYSDNNYL